MHSDSKRLLIFLFIIWVIFIIWELDIQQLKASLQASIVRFDLMVLPVLLFVTAYAIYNIFKNEKQREKLK